MFRPLLETLEARDLLSVYLTLSGTALTAVGSPDAAHRVLLRPNAAAGFDVVADGVTTTFPTLSQFNYFGGVGNDSVVNRTTIPGNLSLGNGNVSVYTIAPRSFVTAGDGNDILQVTGGNSSIFAGNGNDSLYGGPGDTINVGSGQDVIYDILPGNQSVTVAPHHTVDHLFVGPQTTLTGALPQDHVAAFFTVAPQGSGTLARSGSTVYFAGNNAGDTFIALGSSQLLVVSYNLNDGTGFHTQSFTGVNQLAIFGGSGNDTFINASTVDDAQYGAGGSNFLEGGFGSLDLEKAGGAAATGSIAIGRSGVANDLNGSGQTNTSNTLIFTDPHANNIARTNSPTDTILGSVSSLISLYPDNVIAALLPPWVAA